jgi:hypothetical protein
MRHVVYDAKIEHRVKARVRGLNTRGVTHHDACAGIAVGDASLCLLHHPRVQIEPNDFVGTEYFQDNPKALSSAAAYFQGSASGHHPAHFHQLAGLDPSLNQRAERVVHERIFQTVEYDGAPRAAALSVATRYDAVRILVTACAHPP